MLMTLHLQECSLTLYAIKLAVAKSVRLLALAMDLCYQSFDLDNWWLLRSSI